MSKRIQTSFLSFVVIFVLAACNLPLPAVENSAEAEAVLQTITAQAQILEQAGQPATVIPIQQTILITATPDAAGAPPSTEVVVPAAVLPPATGAVTVTVSVATNCRSGPGQNFANLYGMPVGQVAKVIAKNSYTGYWIIEIPGKNGQTCWLWGQYASVTGDTASLKDVVTPTSVATLTPTATVTPTITNTSTVAGCTDPNATNYNPAASTDDGSCTYKTEPPIITNASVACEDQLDGNYKFTFTIDWLKNNTRSGLDYYITYQWELSDGTIMSYEEVPVSTSPVIFSAIKPAGWELEIDFIIDDTLGLTNGARSDAVELTCP